MSNVVFSRIRGPLYSRSCSRSESRCWRDPCVRVAAAAGNLVLAIVASGCASPSVIPVETPMPATLDVSPFARVMVAGFIGGGSDEIDANVETTRLLKSQLRIGSRLKVVDASDPLPLVEMAAQSGAGDVKWRVVPVGSRTQVFAQRVRIPRSQGELQRYEHIFSDVAFWKRIGEEYQQPLIITGTLLFTLETRSGLVVREREVFDAAGRRRLESKPAFVEQTVHTLNSRFIFIDGRTGAIMYSEILRESAVSEESQGVKALSAYFQLMDRIVPALLGTVTNHKVRGERALLR